MMNIIGNKRIYLGLSAILVIASLAVIATLRLKQGIDFTGGTAWRMRLASNPSADAVRDLMAERFPNEDISVIPEDSGSSLMLRLPEIGEDKHAGYRAALEGKFGAMEELSYETIGPAIGGELKRKAVWAFIGVLLVISLYIAFAFREVSRPVNSWKYGLVTLVTLFHDAVIPLGLIALLKAEVTTNIVVGLLVVVGFSVHDTIVVFDRIRENLRHAKPQEMDFDALVNASVNQTMIRSFNTSFTLILTLAALLMFGSASLFYFILVILVGVTVGTYSSIFVASPLLTLWKGKKA